MSKCQRRKISWNGLIGNRLKEPETTGKNLMDLNLMPADDFLDVDAQLIFKPFLNFDIIACKVTVGLVRVWSLSVERVIEFSRV